MYRTFVQNQSETERYEMWGLVTTLQLRRETSEDNPREKYSCLITSLITIVLAVSDETQHSISGLFNIQPELFHAVLRILPRGLFE